MPPKRMKHAAFFRLARQQCLDGAGGDANWMGMTPAEFDAWMRHDTLPSGGKFRA